MLNTCSIGRRWKSREGWSRPVLTGERGTLFPIPFGGSGLVLWWFSRWMARNAVSCGRNDDTGKAFIVRVRCPVPGPPRPESWLVPLPAAGFPVGRLEWFCGGHGPGETPGPFPNPEAKAWHGDGTALERVWESSAPPHPTVWTFWSSPLRDSRKVPFFLFSWGFPGLYARREPPFFMLSSGVRFPWRAGGSHSTTPPASHGLPA